MANVYTVFSTNVIQSTNIRTIDANDDEFVLVTEGTQLIASNARVFGHSATSGAGSFSLTNFGSLLATRHTVLYNKEGFSLYNGASGAIGSYQPDFARGVSITGDSSSIVNLGEIFGKSAISLTPSVGGTVVTNSGVLNGTGSSAAVDAAITVYADTTLTADVIIDNSGTINGAVRDASAGGGQWAIDVNVFDSSASEYVPGLAGVDLTNSGDIRGNIQLGTLADEVSNSGQIFGDLLTEAGDDTVSNRALIDGDVSLGAGADDYSGLGGGRVTGSLNAGAGDDTLRVEQDDAVIDGGADSDILFARSDVLDVTNVETIRLLGGGNFEVLASDGAELIQGNLGNNLLQGEGGNDTITGGGGDDEIQGGAGLDEITGNTGDDLINAGADNDTVSGGAGSDTILGAAGEDDLNGGAGHDSVDGGDNDDTLSGFSGDDTLLGGGGADLLVGHDGNDSLDGGIANDTLDGGLGNDILEGGDGSDILRGQAGNDTLAGGQGLDYLTGGQGADDFLFRSTAETGNGATRDQIIDFARGEDRINLSEMIDGALTFVGTGPFTAANQVRLIETGSGSTIVQINLDADTATVEGEIRVANVAGLTVDDFAL